MVIVDPVTQHQEFVDDMTCKKLTSHYLKFLKIRTGANVVGFFILSSRMFGKEIRELFGNTADDLALKAKFRKDKSLIVTSAGYDEYYIVNTYQMGKSENNLEIDNSGDKKMSAKKMAAAFSKFALKKSVNRVLLRNFVERIAGHSKKVA